MKLYTKDHEWVVIDGDIATFGITTYAQDQLGDVVFVEVPDVGKTLDKGSEAAVVESVKAASDVYAPIAGEVVAVNDAVPATPESLNEKPYEAWLFRVKPADPAALAAMLDAAAYEKLIG